MYIKLTTARDITNPLCYNEKKVKNGEAMVLDCVNFFKDPLSMNIEDKLEGFRRLTSLNQRTNRNTLHISLNFHPAEDLSNDKLVLIADRFMAEIGFNHQPYIVYRHTDAGHPHVHIVSVNIDSTGRRIAIHYKEMNGPNKMKLSIEQEFGLLTGESYRPMQTHKISAGHSGKLIYGKSATKQTIERVLSIVLDRYRFSNIDELNAALHQYNVIADRGKPHSIMRRLKGLVFQALDQNGKRRGVPIKASRLVMKPTLKNLGKLFIKNQELLILLRPKLIAKIKWALADTAGSIDAFVLALKKEGIDTVFRKGSRGEVYSLIYIDNQTKAVCNGCSLGKDYSARAVLARYGTRHQVNAENIIPSFSPAKNKTEEIYSPVYQKDQTIKQFIKDISMMFKPISDIDGSPDHLHPVKKRRKRKRIS